MTSFDVYAKHANRFINVSIDTVKELSILVEKGSPATLLGYNDYTKHVINLSLEHVVAVVDDRYAGMSFRDVPVLRESEVPDCKQVVACDYGRIVDFKRKHHATLQSRRIGFKVASKYGDVSTRSVDWTKQDPVYAEIFAQESQRPTSMIGINGILNVLEHLRACLMLPGDVAEIGAWQGGSAWSMAKFLERTGSKKQLHVFDLGEKQDRASAQAIVCEDEMRRALSFYPGARCVFGDALEGLRKLEGRQFCFAFLDFGFDERIMTEIWDRLVPGAILVMDNYGYLEGHPYLFDAFIEARRSTVIRRHGTPIATAFKR